MNLDDIIRKGLEMLFSQGNSYLVAHIILVALLVWMLVRIFPSLSSFFRGATPLTRLLVFITILIWLMAIVMIPLILLSAGARSPP